MRAYLYGAQCGTRRCAGCYTSMEVEGVKVTSMGVAFQARCTRCGGPALVLAAKLEPAAPPDPRSTAAVVTDALGSPPVQRRPGPYMERLAGAESIDAGELSRRLSYNAALAPRGRQKRGRR